MTASEADLIARLEKLSGPSRTLANEVLLACGWTLKEFGDGPTRSLVWIDPAQHEDFLEGDQPDPTASIEAALTLRPKSNDPHWEWRVIEFQEWNRGNEHWFWRARLSGWPDDKPLNTFGEHAAPAISLCIALVRIHFALAKARDMPSTTGE